MSDDGGWWDRTGGGGGLLVPGGSKRWKKGLSTPQAPAGMMDDGGRKSAECSGRTDRETGVKLEKEGESRQSKTEGGGMTGNLGICRTEIASHLDRLSKRKADFTADGSAVAGLWTPAASVHTQL